MEHTLKFKLAVIGTYLALAGLAAGVVYYFAFVWNGMMVAG